jgi:hypothetical protein
MLSTGQLRRCLPISIGLGMEVDQLNPKPERNIIVLLLWIYSFQRMFLQSLKHETEPGKIGDGSRLHKPWVRAESAFI